MKTSLASEVLSLESYSGLLRELHRRELAVLEWQNRVDRFVLNLLSSANLSGLAVKPPERGAVTRSASDRFEILDPHGRNPDAPTRPASRE
jgi:hypothetical protein